MKVQKRTPTHATASQDGELLAAPGNAQPIGGLEVVADSGWFAARPSGTENLYKIYAEGFRGRSHLQRMQQKAQQTVAAALSRPAGGGGAAVGRRKEAP